MLQALRLLDPALAHLEGNMHDSARTALKRLLREDGMPLFEEYLKDPPVVPKGVSVAEFWSSNRKGFGRFASALIAIPGVVTKVDGQIFSRLQQILCDKRRHNFSAESLRALLHTVSNGDIQGIIRKSPLLLECDSEEWEEEDDMSHLDVVSGRLPLAPGPSPAGPSIAGPSAGPSATSGPSSAFAAPKKSLPAPTKQTPAPAKQAPGKQAPAPAKQAPRKATQQASQKALKASQKSSSPSSSSDSSDSESSSSAPTK